MKSFVKPSVYAALSIALSACGAPAADLAAPAGQPAAAAAEIVLSLALAPELHGQLRALIGDGQQIAYDEVRAEMSGALPAAQGKANAPALAVSAPLGWQEGAAPLFTFVPDLPESEIQELRYFDQDGASFTLPASEKPSRPVIVVGADERLPAQAADEGAATLASKRLVVGQVRITDDHEPWYKGDPEIYARCTFPATGSFAIILDLPEVNKTSAWYTVNRVLGTYQESYGTPARCGLYESDGITDGSDSLGWREVWFSSPYGTKTITDGAFTLNP